MPNQTAAYISMETNKHLILSILMASLLILGGTCGYMLIERWDILDALYMTVITLTTVGYGEVHVVSEAGRIYTIILIITGVGFFLYVGGAVVQYMVEWRMPLLMGRRKLNRKIDRLKNHLIVCGYGRIGKVICDKLLREKFTIVVIDKNPALPETLNTLGLISICGDATDEETLLKVGVLKAKALIAVLGTDTENVFLVLTARQLVPGLNIIARAGTEAAKAKLLAAGANRVEAPYETGAASIAHRVLRPTVTSFIDLALTDRHKEIQIEELPVAPQSKLIGAMLKDSGIRQKYNLIIIAIKRPDDRMLFNPSFETVIHAEDTLIAMGAPSSLKKLASVLDP